MNVTLVPAVRYISAFTGESLTDICTTAQGAAAAADHLAFNGHKDIRLVTVLLVEDCDEVKLVTCGACGKHAPTVRFVASRRGVTQACEPCRTRLGWK